jgi:hypothetical protein
VRDTAAAKLVFVFRVQMLDPTRSTAFSIRDVAGERGVVSSEQHSCAKLSISAGAGTCRTRAASSEQRPALTSTLVGEFADDSG